MQDHALPEGEMVLSHASEDSVLLRPDAARVPALFICDRQRRATCSGVAWLPGRCLAAVNLEGGTLRIYRFHPQAEGGAARLELMHEISDGIYTSEDVAASPDGRMLAITLRRGTEFRLGLYRIDLETKAPLPAGELAAAYPGLLHGVRFSPDSRYLAITGFAEGGFVEMIRADPAAPGRACLIHGFPAALRPKSIAFTRDGKYAAISIGQTAAAQAAPGLGGLLRVHRYDPRRGAIAAAPTAELSGDGPLENMEMLASLPTPPTRPYHILAANQAADFVASFEFAPAEGTLAYRGVFLAGQSFPHGIDASADGRLVAVANYGDDTVRIARVRAGAG